MKKKDVPAAKGETVKAGPVNRFLNRVRMRSRSPKKQVAAETETKDVHFKIPDVPKKPVKKKKVKSDRSNQDRSQSPLNRIMHRLSGRRANTISSQSNTDNSATFTPNDTGRMSTPPPSPTHEKEFQATISTPRGAISECDLRNVTLRRGYDEDVPITPLVGGGVFLSENNISGLEVESTPRRSPSYLRISTSLHGYVKSPRRMENSPSKMMGQSLVERRLEAFSQVQNRPSQCTTPVRSSASRSDTTTAGPHPFTVSQLATPSQSVENTMGQNVSTPSPIKGLISQFEKINLCTRNEKDVGDVKENITPQMVVISQPVVTDVEKQPMKSVGNGVVPGAESKPEEIRNEKIEQKKEQEKEEVTVPVSDVPEVKVTTSAFLQSEVNKTVESENEQKEHRTSVIMVKPVSTEEATSVTKEINGNCKVIEGSARDAHYFCRLSKSRRNELIERTKKAQKELDEDVNKRLPDEVTGLLMRAVGQAHLLMRKKFDKFDEMTIMNMDGDSRVTLDDLDGFWAMVDGQIDDIDKTLEEVEQWRRNGWTAPVKASVPLSSPSTAVKTQRAPSRAAAVPNAEKQKAADERRKQMIAQAKKRLRDQQTAASSETSDVVMVL